MKENKPKKAHMQLRAPLGEEEQRLQVEKKKIEPVRKTRQRKRRRIEKQTTGVGMGNDNKARRDVIISRLPNRLEPKTTASATGEKSIPSTVRSVKGITQQN